MFVAVCAVCAVVLLCCCAVVLLSCCAVVLLCCCAVVLCAVCCVLCAVCLVRTHLPCIEFLNCHHPMESLQSPLLFLIHQHYMHRNTKSI